MKNKLLSPDDVTRIVSGNHPEPRSVLGFHEVKVSGERKWLIRVMETNAESVSLFWEEDNTSEISLDNIDPAGLFEIVISPRRELKPYQVRILYPNGTEVVRHDPFYFSPQLTEYDVHLFSEGNHHQIYRKFGAHPEIIDGVAGTAFTVWAPNAKRVSVVGDFNLWDGLKNPMNLRGMTGIWELFIPGIAEGEIYKYEIKAQNDDVFLKSDPYGFAMQERPDTASKVANLDGYSWNDSDWMNERPKRNIYQEPVSIYEVHLGSWKRVPEEEDRMLTYREAAEQLIPYAQEMGYTHIELLPISEHPLDASWGYQVSGYYAPTARFGSPQDFMYFVDCCHQAGLGLILDWVPGHFPKDSAGLACFDGTSLYEHDDPRQGEHLEWGTLVFNYGRNEVRNFLIANALFWFDYYHIDGIRVDAVASMLYLNYNRDDGDWIPNKYGGTENLEAINFFRKMHEVLFAEYPGILSIAEESTSFSGVSHPVYLGGLGFNFKWNMGWMHDSLKYTSLDPVFRKFQHHVMSFSMVYAYSENFMLPISHDEVVHGKYSLINKMPGDFWQQRANYRMYLAFQMAHPGKQLLFMGSEFGQFNEWCEARSLDWHLLDNDENKKLKDYNQQLNWFYRENPALFTNDFHESGFEWIDMNDYESSVFSFIRYPGADFDCDPIVFVFNFTPVPRNGYALGVPEKGNYEKIFDTDDYRFGGSSYNQQTEVPTEDVNWQGRDNRLMLDLPPLGCMALRIKR